MEWSHRCDWENKKATSGAYITLTYESNHIPLIVNGDGEIVQSLYKRDFQLFMKRLRKEQSKVSDQKLRFFACGEYGEKSKRPHYHALIWNIHGSIKNKIGEIWRKGFVKVGTIESKSIRYVTNYMMKKNIDGPKGSYPYFTLMSRKPGIGYNYLEKTRDNHIFHEDYRLKTAKKLEKRPIINRFYQSKFSLKEQIEIIKQRRENFEEKSLSDKVEAEKNDPLDPLGYLYKQKIKKIELAKSKEKLKSKNNKI